MSSVPCAAEAALKEYYRKQEQFEDDLQRAEESLYMKISPFIEIMKDAIKYHVQHNNAGMDYQDSKKFIIDTLEQLL